MAAKKRSAGQSRWLKEHFDDPYVRQAHKRGMRSRAGFKLEQLQQKDHLLKPGFIVVDLGAAPGGWSEYAVKCVGEKGKVIAVDILPLKPIKGVTFLQGDFREDEVFLGIYDVVKEGADVVLSDMAPNMSGINGIDQPRAMLLSELALDMARRVLKKGGSLVVKVFTGQGSQEFLTEVKKDFMTVRVRKPDASRDRSREVYIIGQGFKGHELSGVSPKAEHSA